MRKGRDGEKNGGKKKRQKKIVATTSLPAVDHLNAELSREKLRLRLHK